ncbi:hypothetical protein niasHT_008949 [Heterodera trifolii]|uniref:Uncharacterized protein n=1 Tax=Heterodera trifolii TaxID=157864 RepID=A0ABD2LY69_9BILA
MLAWLLFAITAFAVVCAPNQTNGFNQSIGLNQTGSNQTGFNTTALNRTNGPITAHIPPGNQVENEPHRINGSNATALNNGDGTNVANGTWPMALIGNNPILDNSLIFTNSTAVAIRHKRSFEWTSVLISLLKGLGGIGTFLLDLGKDIIMMVAKTATEKLLEQAFRKDCESVAKACTSCGWGACHISPGAVASACCREDYSYTCCEKDAAADGEAVSRQLGSKHGSAIAPPPVLKGCQKMQSECPKDCTWGACHPHEGAIGDECCKAGYGFKCCEEIPKKETDCDLLKKRCVRGSGKCFPANGTKGDGCCAADHELVCAQDMSHDQRTAAYPLYGQLWDCAMQGHPDKESLMKCFPQVSGCSEFFCGKYGVKKYFLGVNCQQSDEPRNPVKRMAQEEFPLDLVQPDVVCNEELEENIFGCPKLLGCFLRPHKSLASLKVCMPNDLRKEEQCAEPLPPTEEPPTTAQTSTQKPPDEIPIETGGGGQKPYVDVLDVDNCTNMVKELCNCGYANYAYCVLRVGYARTPCCPNDYDLVCCAKKAKSIDLVRMEFEAQGRLNETYEPHVPPTDITELNSTASPDSATTFCCLRSTVTICAFSAAIAFLLMTNTLP